MVKGKNKIVKNVTAVPVAPRETTTNINQVADKVVVMHSPYPFSAVVDFNQDFGQASYNEVKETNE